MAEKSFELSGIEKGPNCADCIAVDECPAMLLQNSIEVLNSDLAESEVPDGVKDRVFGEYFAYGLKKYRDQVASVQAAVNRCKGGVRVRKVADVNFRYPSFGDLFGSDYDIEEPSETLEARGFVVTLRVEERVNEVKDPDATTPSARSYLGYNSDGGLRGTINKFRKAARFK